MDSIFNFSVRKAEGSSTTMGGELGDYGRGRFGDERRDGQAAAGEPGPGLLGRQGCGGDGYTLG